MAELEKVSILGVDDQKENLLALEAIFAGSDINLITVSSGQEALKQILHTDFAVILLDAFMPEMDGFETAKIIHSREKSKSTPIIFLTATHKESIDAAKGYELGAVDYIFKPAEPDILRAKVAVFVALFKKTREAQRQREELAKLNLDLEHLSKEARESRDQALEVAKFKSDFLANMSHEIRTPMNGILGMIEILLKSGLTPKQRGYANTAREAGHSLLAVINDILDFSKIEAGRLTLAIEDFEPIMLVESIAELLSAQAKEQSLSILTFIDPAIPRLVRGDQTRLRQIITNLAGNAVKFSERGEVLIRVILDSKNDQTVKVKFSVSDRGIGLTEQEISQLFQPFVQTSLTSTRAGGTGLGLSICKRLVELMGGEIGVTSVKHHGSTFWFTVPFQRSFDDGEQRKPSTFDISGVRAMVVDDEPGAREILHNYLISWGMQNGTASSADEAMELLAKEHEKNPYHLALIDLMMPGTDGIALGKRIREDGRFKDIKLILITAFDKPGAGEEAIFLGFDAYLNKPIKQSQLLNTISTLVATSSEISEADKKSKDKLTGQKGEPTRLELVLVAEDHPINQMVALLLLQEMGFEAHIADNGNKVLDLIKRIPYSIIFMDCQMPEMDGYQTTRTIRKQETRTGKRIPIIAMTAHAIEGNRDECIAAGMDDYVSKPIDPVQLKSILDKWLPQQEPSRGSQVITSELKQIYEEELEPFASEQKTLTGESGAEATGLFSMEKLKHQVGDDAAYALLEIFLSESTNELGGMKEAAQEEDTKRFLGNTHTLRSVFGTIYADELYGKVAYLEDMARTRPWSEIYPELAEFEKSVSEIREIIEQILKERAPH